MRNLKKILALVLALVMSFSLVSVSSAAFKDANAFTADYEEAVEVLTGLKVIKGYEDGSFKPKGNISRAEAAAIIYRVVTGDVKDELVDIYAGYGKFDDVTADNWAAGYVGYCANGEYIKGYNDTTFGPKDDVTGYQMLAMLLRALGYGKNGEFTGPNWDINTARYAESLGLLDNVVSAHAALRLPATRELVCELVFSALTKTPMVTYTLLTNYQPITVECDNDTWTKTDDWTFDWTLGYETFGLIRTASHRDAWGRPAVSWYVDNNRDPEFFNTAAKYRVATFAQEADFAFNTAMDECCIAEELGVETTADIGTVYVNGYYNTITASYYFGARGELTANDTKNMIGEQGRQVEFYWNATSKAYDVVMIDTFFAIVSDVTEVEYDKNGHIAEYAELELMIFTNEEPALYETVVLIDDENWEYEQYDCLLVNAWTEDALDEEIDLDATKDTVASGYDDTDADDKYDAYVEIVGEPDVFVGAQSAFTNQPTHIVDEVEYDDAYQLVLDEAGLETTNHLWFKDQFGNIIAIMDDVTDYSYGTISAIKWVDTNDLMTNGYALATITNMDGEQADYKIYKINGTVLKGVEGDVEVYGETVSSTKQYNDTYLNVALYEIEETSKGLVLTELTKLDENAETQTGVAEIGWTEDGDFMVYGGKTTKYLVWTGTKYVTYTGIKNIPSLNENNTFWAGVVDAAHPVAEYVFVNGAKQNADLTNITFFAFEEANLKVKTVLYNGIYYYTISGGYVNGELNSITIPAGEEETKYTDNELVMFILNNSGALLNLETSNGYVYAGNVVSVLAEEIESTETYAIYAGEAADAILDKDVLILGGNDYDVDGAKLISYKNKSLSWHVKNDDGYVFVVYAENDRTFDKNATYVYVTDVAGASLFEVAQGLYEYYSAELLALIEELDTMGIALAAAPEADDYETTIEYKIALVEYYTTMMNAALAEMNTLAETEEETAVVTAATTEAAKLEDGGEVAIVVAILDYAEQAVADFEALTEMDADDVTAADLAAVKAVMDKAAELMDTVEADVVNSNDALKAAADYTTAEFETAKEAADEALTNEKIVAAALEAIELDEITITYVTDEDATVTVVNELSYAIAKDASIVALNDVFAKVEVEVMTNDTLAYDKAAVKDMTFTVTVTVTEKAEEDATAAPATTTANSELKIKVTYKTK